MAIIERVDREDLILYEVMKNPVLFTEFIYNLDKQDYEKPFILDYYQKEFMLDFSSYVSLSCARSVGKSESLSALILWLLIFAVFPEYIVYTVPGKVHLEPVFTKLIRSIRSNSFLKNFIDAKVGINSSDYSIKFLNNTTLLCRIAGQTGTGANVIGLHTAFVILDESGYYPWGTWTEMQPILNTFMSGYRLIVSGVPTGLRERNVNYHCDMENPAYSKHNISALQNPRFTEEDRLKAVDQYGGEDSDDYIHLVLGQHGKPIFSLFDRSLFEIQSYNVYKMTISGNDFGDNLTLYHNKLALFPSISGGDGNVIFGIDLGYTEPTAIIIMYLDSFGRMKFHGRIRMDKVSLGIQDRLINFLDSRFNPGLIGIDAGGLGLPITQRLLDSEDYATKDYHKRLYPIDFSQNIIIGIDANGDELKNKAKPLAVSVLQEYSNAHKIVYSSMDTEMITELERMTYTKTPTGEIVYRTLTERGGRKGEDHFTSALLCGVLGYYMKNETINLFKNRGKLFKPRWFAGR